tara:strand:+ start:211 stop:345 length:135 start_codon:yes stop_codon:yes gene_type:complete
MKKIDKKYSELMYFAEHAIGRKEVISFLKKASKLKSEIDEKIFA